MRLVFEKSFSLLALILLSPLLTLIAFLVRLDSPGPVIFRQVRVGQGQKLSSMYKFRTMYVGAEHQHASLVRKQLDENGSFLLSGKIDDRSTRIGRFLRKLSLDELPQFVNVLKGEMSLVGPRPMLPSELPYLTEAQMRRFCILPGITGLAQINGRSALSADAYVGFDLALIDARSPLLYWSILVQTPLVVLRMRGAN